MPYSRLGLKYITFLFLYLVSLPFIQSQDIDAILAVQEIDTMLYSGPKDNRINWVIQNRGDGFEDKEEFTTLYREDLLKAFEQGHDLAQTPYAQYRNFFNLYTFWWPDALDDDTGWNFNIIKQLRDRIFLPWATEDRGWVTFFSTTRHGGGGGAGLNRDARVGDGKMFGMGFETFLHEFGHTMPGLLDEYSASGEWSNSQCWETGNSTGQLIWENIPWRRWIDEDTPLPTPYTEQYLDKIGAFEGAMTNFFGCHRPTARGCFMGAGGFGEDYGLDLCSPCIQRVICFLYRYVDVIENAMPEENEIEIAGAETIRFSVDIVKPEPNTQQYKWILNGKTIATDVEFVELSFDACESHELIFAVHDTNTLVRYDSKFEETYPKPYQERVWKINQLDVEEYSLSATEETTNSDCTDAATGGVSFTISGGLEPYSVYLNQELQNNPQFGLDAGNYSFDIIDANGCSVSKEISIESDLLLDPQICAVQSNGKWMLRVSDENYSEGELEYIWSTLEETPEIIVDSDGSYTVSVYNQSCIVDRSITLVSGIDPLSVEHLAFPSDINNATGRIYLNIRDGRPPYSIEWSEKLNTDISDAAPENILSSGTTWDHFPEYAFDDQLNTKWLHAVAENAFIGYEFESPAVVSTYAITSADDVPERDPRNWEFQASDDGVNWQVLDQQDEHEFSGRYERRVFLMDNEDAYRFYRLYIKENYGDIATQIQELELIGVNPESELIPNRNADNQDYRTGLAPGLYFYEIKDQNGSAISDSVFIRSMHAFMANELFVVQNDDCSVKIESPIAEHVYYWFSDIEGNLILDTGKVFSPHASGNYYVAAYDAANKRLSENIKGFAVTVASAPTISVVEGSGLEIVDPHPDMRYQWYDTDQCDATIHTGIDFTPESEGSYYVAAIPANSSRVAVNPSLIDGVIIRMDASDLNGDGVLDNPAPPTSSLYGWSFTNGNKWADNNWFAFRSNYQNGLGVADFATIWLQRIASAETGYQTILMAYEENPISFAKRAPFEGLSRNIPRHSDATQLYSEDAPDRVLSGQTYLNGKNVDPLATPNPLKFCVLGTVMTEASSDEVFYTDTHWEGKIGEIILYDRALTQEEMEGASEYLRKKWISVADLASGRQSFYWNGDTVGTSAIEESKQEIRVLPNPTSGQFTLKGIEDISSVEIFNQSGMLIKDIVNTTDRIDISELSNGIYYARIKSGSAANIIVAKIVKM